MRKLKYAFKDPALFELAMTQSGADAKNNNERLEFLGDRVLGLAVAAMLYEMFPSETEGELARRHAALVSMRTLCSVAREFGFDKSVRHGHMTGGKMDHVAADAMESVIGAIFMDGGWAPALDFIKENWTELAAAAAKAPKDPKTELQELAQHYGDGSLPEYKFLDGGKGGFEVSVAALGREAGGAGGTKKAATADAAKNLLTKLKG